MFYIPDLSYHDLEKLTDFEEKLEQDGLKGKFSRYLKNLVGVSFKNTVQLILWKNMSPELGMLHPMRGKNSYENQLWISGNIYVSAYQVS